MYILAYFGTFFQIPVIFTLQTTLIIIELGTDNGWVPNSV